MECRDNRAISVRDNGRAALIVSVLWSLAPGQQLASWGWDDEFVVYNNLSGDTHLLDADSMALLAHLQHTPSSIDTLVDTFADGVEPEDAVALPDTMATLLALLKKLNLVVAPC